MSQSYQGGDPADYPQSSCQFDYDAVDESIALKERIIAERDEARRRPQQQQQIVAVPVVTSTADALVKLIAFIIDSNNYLLQVDVIIAGSGLALHQGWSYTQLADKHAISKQAFDKHVLKFQKDFQLPVTRAQKSPAARVSYEKTQLDRQARLRQTHAATIQREKERNAVWQNSSKKAQKAQLVK